MSGITDSFKEMLKSRVAITDVVSEFTQLSRRGTSIVGCCPFHKEKTPSFYVYEDDGHYHCYGCKAHGDAFDILMEKRGYTFIEAVKYLCDRTGLPMPELKDTQEVELEEHYFELMSFVAEFYHKALFSKEGQQALTYLQQKRGLLQATIKAFKLGYAPSGDQLQSELVRQKYNLEHAVLLGVLGKGDRGGFYDPMRQRLMFPIMNLRGRVIAFGGRILQDQKGVAKYRNTGDTPLFKKKHVLYGADRLKEYRRAPEPILCVEGYMDVIALHQAGYPKAVAALGTAFGQSHLEALWAQNGRYENAPNPTLCFDGDQAGINSAKAAFEKSLPFFAVKNHGQQAISHSVDFLILGQGQDPDDYVKNHGLKAFKQLVDKRFDAFDYFYQTYYGEGQTSESPERGAQRVKKAHYLINLIQDKELREGWFYKFEGRRKKGESLNEKQKFASPYGVKGQKYGLRAQERLGASYNRPYINLSKPKVHVDQLDARQKVYEKKVLSWFKKCPELCDYICENYINRAILDARLLEELYQIYEDFHHHQELDNGMQKRGHEEDSSKSPTADQVLGSRDEGIDIKMVDLVEAFLLHLEEYRGLQGEIQSDQVEEEDLANIFGRSKHKEDLCGKMAVELDEIEKRLSHFNLVEVSVIH